MEPLRRGFLRSAIWERSSWRNFFSCINLEGSSCLSEYAILRMSLILSMLRFLLSCLAYLTFISFALYFMTSSFCCSASWIRFISVWMRSISFSCDYMWLNFLWESWLFFVILVLLSFYSLSTSVMRDLDTVLDRYSPGVGSWSNAIGSLMVSGDNSGLLGD